MIVTYIQFLILYKPICGILAFCMKFKVIKNIDIFDSLDGDVEDVGGASVGVKILIWLHIFGYEFQLSSSSLKAHQLLTSSKSLLVLRGC